jgi:hypothetical protein
MDIADLRKSSEQRFSLSLSISQTSRPRERPKIPLATGLDCILETVALGQRRIEVLPRL